MDTSGFSQIGRYGTLSLMKRQEPDTPITSFGLDHEELTFGRETTCGVRLYYPDIAVLHCKLVFQERKAFLVVLGDSGVVVDDCKVYPHTSAESGTSADGASQSTIIPLMNNSEFEIHNKRFRFTYPPKDIRATLFATPPRSKGRALRLSMIHSAQVFSPRPSNDPRENLRILQSPLKNTFKSPVKARLGPSPLKATVPFQPIYDQDEGEEIVLVHGNHPRVVEEDRDLVILEDVPVQVPSIIPSSPRRTMDPPRTPPRRKSLGGNALHRAVLIRSAQRAVIKAEQEREEEEEELEVLGAVVGEEIAGDEDDEDEPNYGNNEKGYDQDDEIQDAEMEDVEMDSPSDSEDEVSGDEAEEENDEPQHAATHTPIWKKSLEKIWPFGGRPVGDMDSAQEEDGDNIEGKNASNEESDEEEEHHEENADADPAPLPIRLLQPTPVRRPLGSFMTPQQGRPRDNIFPRNTNTEAASATNVTSAPPPVAGRHSLGGGQPQRIMVQQPWKVRDLVVPTPSSNTGDSKMPEPSPVRRLFATPSQPPATPLRGAPAVFADTPIRPMGTPRQGRPTLTNEERKVIQERRRSALREGDSFFAGGVPGMGMSPMKSSSGASSSSSSEAASSRRTSTSPTKFGYTSMFSSPHKARPSTIGEDIEQKEELKEKDEELDTQSLLERMKETVEDMKRRSSILPSTPAPASRMNMVPPPTDKADRLDLSQPAAASGSTLGLPETLDDSTLDADTKVKEPEPFSLLRPGARESRLPARRTRAAAAAAMEPPAPSVPLVIVSPDDMPEDESQEIEKPERKGKSRLLRAPKPTKKAEEEEEQEVYDGPENSNAKLIAPPKSATRRGRSRTPLPHGEEEGEQESAKPASNRRSRKPTSEPEEPTPATATKRGRKAAAEPEVESIESGLEKPRSKAQPAQRSRKPAAAEPVVDEQDTEEDQETSESAPAPAKRGRPRKVVVDEPPTQEEAPPTKPKAAKKPAAKLRGTKKAVAAAAVEGEDDDEDPLDSYNPSEQAAPAPKVRGRKKAVAKQEEEEPSLDEATKPNRSSTKSTATAATAKTPVARSRGGKTIKTPATAPAAAAAGQKSKVNKENAPDMNGSGGGGSSPAEDAVEPTVKVRVSKTRAGTTSGKNSAARGAAKNVKQEVDEEPVPTRTTRTRTRTKTS